MTQEATRHVLTHSEFIDALDTTPTLNLSPEKTFSTGSRGFTINTRLVLGGKQYVGTMNLVELGSKPAVVPAPAAPAAASNGTRRSRNSGS